MYVSTDLITGAHRAGGRGLITGVGMCVYA